MSGRQVRRFTCDNPDCGRALTVGFGKGPADGFHGNVELAHDGSSDWGRQQWFACSPNCIRPAVEAITARPPAGETQSGPETRHTSPRHPPRQRHTGRRVATVRHREAGCPRRPRSLARLRLQRRHLGDAMTELADRFRATQLATCDELAAETSYNPTQFRRDVETKDGDGGVAYTKRLVENSPTEGTYGLKRMLEIGRPRQTIEWQVCLPEWRDLFHWQTRAAARFRLSEHGITAPAEENT